jgi:hypothetical protein
MTKACRKFGSANRAHEIVPAAIDRPACPDKVTSTVIDVRIVQDKRRSLHFVRGVAE